MKKIFISLLLVWSTIGAVVNAQDTSLLERLKEIPGLEINVLGHDEQYTEKYEVYISQPVDHADPEAGTFRQRFFICHKGFDRPVVFVTEGYAADYAENPRYKNELSIYLEANEIIVEHRYFHRSAPEPLDWKYLTVKNAATDHHRIIELMKAIYGKGPWVSTGISKGGQTSMYHRYFFPDDVDATVAYVAPLNFSIEDLRVYDFLENHADTSCKGRLVEFQTMLLKNREDALPFFKKVANKKNLHYSMGLEAGFELMVLEYPFAFWQWGLTPCDSVPGYEAGPEKWISHLDKVAGLDWVAEEGIAKTQPFFYQALTEIGMYGYDLEPFGDLIEALENNTFTFSCPEGAECVYNPWPMRKVDAFIRHEAENMMFLYGEWDPWSSTGVQWSGNPGVRVFVKPGGSHLTRIRNYPQEMREEILSTLEKWIETEVKRSLD